jgi:hypothetical protein
MVAVPDQGQEFAGHPHPPPEKRNTKISKEDKAKTVIVVRKK